MAGLILDPWEEYVLSNALGENRDRTWTAFEVGLCVPRQNGKDAILEARELVGLFLLEEPLIVHSAHQWDTSLEHFTRLENLIEGSQDLSRRVKRIVRSHGEEGITLDNGCRIRFRTRTKGGGRGFTGDCVIFNEAMEIPERMHGALLPTLSARSITGNPQVWYAGTSVDQWTHENGVVFARVRDRGHAGGDPSLAYFEWSLDDANPEWVGDETATDEESWGVANPALGIRISAEHIAKEQRAMDPRTFAVERLGVGDWPATNPDDEAIISEAKWAACADTDSKALDPLAFSYDVTPDRSTAAIAVAGRREDGRVHVEIIEHRPGTGWVADRLAELEARHHPQTISCDGASPAASLLPALVDLETQVTILTAKEHAAACGSFFDLVEQEALAHLDTADLSAAIKGAATRPLSEAWAWSRKNSTIDISPLVAATLAAWGIAADTAKEPFALWG